MYDLLRYYKEPDKASGAVFSHQNPRLIHLQIDSKNFFLKLNFFTAIFQEFRSQLLQ